MQSREKPKPPSSAAPPPRNPPNNTVDADHGAHIAAECLVPATFARLIDQPLVSASATQRYLGNTLSKAGAPSDPVERILVEQLVIAHHRVAQLHLRAETATTLEGVKIFNAAAVRLLGEVRRLSLALRMYRLPAASRSFQVVHQQNVATGAQQEVTYVNQSQGEQTNVSFAAKCKVEGTPDANDSTHSTHDASDKLRQEREARVRGPNQRLQAAALDG